MTGGIELFMVLSVHDQQWRENFRMSRATFNYLCCELRCELEKKSTRMRSAVSVERRVAIALWRLATNGNWSHVWYS